MVEYDYVKDEIHDNYSIRRGSEAIFGDIYDVESGRERFSRV